MNQITTQYVTENGACYEQYVITDPAAKTSLTTVSYTHLDVYKRQLLGKGLEEVDVLHGVCGSGFRGLAACVHMGKNVSRMNGDAVQIGMLGIQHFIDAFESNI